MFSAQQVVVQSLLFPKVSIAMHMCLQCTLRGTIASKISIETATMSWNKIVSNFYETPHAIFLYSDFFITIFWSNMCSKTAPENSLWELHM